MGVIPKKMASNKTGVMEETIATVLAKKICIKNFPPILRWRYTMKRLFLLPWILRRMWSNRLRENFWGVQGPVVQTQKLYRNGF